MQRQIGWQLTCSRMHEAAADEIISPANDERDRKPDHCADPDEAQCFRANAPARKHEVGDLQKHPGADHIQASHAKYAAPAKLRNQFGELAHGQSPR